MTPMDVLRRALGDTILERNCRKHGKVERGRNSFPREELCSPISYPILIGSPEIIYIQITLYRLSMLYFYVCVCVCERSCVRLRKTMHKEEKVLNLRESAREVGEGNERGKLMSFQFQSIKQIT